MWHFMKQDCNDEDSQSDASDFTFAWTSSMYKLPRGSWGGKAIFKGAPTPTPPPTALSYMQTRDITGVVPSGNSKGNSAADHNAMSEAPHKLDSIKIDSKDQV